MTSKTYRFGLFSKPTIKEFKDQIAVYGDVTFIFTTIGFEDVKVSFNSIFDNGEIEESFNSFCIENGNLKIKSYYVADGTINIKI